MGAGLFTPAVSKIIHERVAPALAGPAGNPWTHRAEPERLLDRHPPPALARRRWRQGREMGGEMHAELPTVSESERRRNATQSVIAQQNAAAQQSGLKTIYQQLEPLSRPPL